jgi:ribonuclease Y
MGAVIGAIAAAIVALAIGAIVGIAIQRHRQGAATSSASAVLEEARRRARELLERADEEGRARTVAQRDKEDAAFDQRSREARAREDALTQREAALEQRAGTTTQLEALLLERERGLDDARGEVERLREQVVAELERVSGLDARTAKENLLRRVEDQSRHDAMVLVRDLELKAREEADRRARRILASTMQRLASDVVAVTTVSVVPLPSDDMKGRIIGRDGRNIRAFESVTGVNIIVDDTPEAVAVSAFDPVRREVARLTLERLVADGRIHPASIEEAYERTRAEVDQNVREAGEWAMLEVGLSRLHPELVNLLGRMRYRLSYGQNVLSHGIESAKVAGMLAGEIGVDADQARRAAFLHDIGKAVSHELGGSHALVGAEIARRFGEDAAIVHAIEAHHNEVEPRTTLAVIVQIADAVSAARPGARREAVESYVRRLERIEEIASSFAGVERVYALQAGREVRVMVDPGAVDDLGASDLARRISKRLEEDLQYPGQIQVTVIRELRAIDYAR